MNTNMHPKPVWVSVHRLALNYPRAQQWTVFKQSKIKSLLSGIIFAIGLQQNNRMFITYSCIAWCVTVFRTQWLPQLCIEKDATWRDQFCLVKWLLDSMLGPNAAKPNGQTSLASCIHQCVFWGDTKWLQIASCRNSLNNRRWWLLR